MLDTRRRELFAIGPCARAQSAARLPLAARDQRVARALARENYTSIVLWLEAGQAVALFGADMDGHAQVGWASLLEEHDRRQWIRKATLVKVPHHGSEGAHEPEMYARWTHDPVAVLTPNRRGAKPLPDPQMIPKLKQVSRSLWLAGPPDPAVDLGPYDAQGRDDFYEVVAVCDEQGSGGWDLSQTDPGRQL